MSARPEPLSQGAAQPVVCAIPHPGDISVGPDQYGSRCGNRAYYRKFPRAGIFSVHQLDSIGPRSDVEAARFAEIEQYRVGLVQQGEDTQRAVGGH